MNLYVLIAIVMLNQTAFRGTRMLMSLYAIEFGANPVAIGILSSLISLCSLLFALQAGRVSDRFGPRVPMLMGSLGISCAMLLPYLMPGLVTLYFTAIIAGSFMIFFLIATQHLVGALGAGQQRTSNFGTYSLCVGATQFVGPVMTGFSIDQVGHQLTFLLLSLAPMGAAVFLLFFTRRLPEAIAKPKHEERRIMDLVRNVPLRRALIAASVGEAGAELYAFYMPIYGHSLGLSASTIGIVIGTYAAATLVARTVMPLMAKKSNEETVFYRSLMLAAVACSLLPFAASVYPLAAISFVLGLGLGCYAPLSLIIVYNRAPDGRTAETLGLRNMVTKGTEVLVPLVFGTLGSAFGLGPTFWLIAPLLATGSFIMKADARRLAPRS